MYCSSGPSHAREARLADTQDLRQQQEVGERGFVGEHDLRQEQEAKENSEQER